MNGLKVAAAIALVIALGNLAAWLLTILPAWVQLALAGLMLAGLLAGFIAVIKMLFSKLDKHGR